MCSPQLTNSLQLRSLALVSLPKVGQCTTLPPVSLPTLLMNTAPKRTTLPPPFNPHMAVHVHKGRGYITAPPPQVPHFQGCRYHTASPCGMIHVRLCVCACAFSRAHAQVHVWVHKTDKIVDLAVLLTLFSFNLVVSLTP
jgi:hypothetical protein